MGWRTPGNVSQRLAINTTLARCRSADPARRAALPHRFFPAGVAAFRRAASASAVCRRRKQGAVIGCNPCGDRRPAPVRVSATTVTQQRTPIFDETRRAFPRAAASLRGPHSQEADVGQCVGRTETFAGDREKVRSRPAFAEGSWIFHRGTIPSFIIILLYKRG